MFNQFGDLERCALRPGNVHSADGWKEVLDPVVQRYRGKVTRIYFRADAAFAMPEVYDFLEADGVLDADEIGRAVTAFARSQSGRLIVTAARWPIFIAI